MNGILDLAVRAERRRAAEALLEQADFPSVPRVPDPRLGAGDPVHVRDEVAGGDVPAVRADGQVCDAVVELLSPPANPFLVPARVPHLERLVKTDAGEAGAVRAVGHPEDG